MRSGRTTCLLLASSCLLTGSALYILFRPTSLVLFAWANSLGLTEIIESARAWADGFDEGLPHWVVGSLPFALWISFYLFLIGIIWGDSRSLIRQIWFWSIPVVAIFAELGQIIHLVPGSFYVADLIANLLCASLSVAIINKSQINKGVTTS